jgi:stage IV sporulation protein FB
MRFANGYLELGRLRGALIRVHWSMPLGALLFTRFELRPVAWLCVTLVIFLHELGHAATVWACQRRVIAIDLLPIGGLCRWDGRPVTPFQRACIAFGGVWAQLLLLAVVLLVGAIAGPPAQPWTFDAQQVLVSTNLFIMGFNLLPIAPLDGAEAWRFFPLGWARLTSWWRERRANQDRKDSIQQRLRAWDEQAKAAGSDQEAAALIGRIVREAQTNKKPDDTLLN